MVQTQAVQPPCNSRATDGLETGRFGQERSGLRVSGNPDSIGRFGSGQVRPAYDSSNPAGATKIIYIP